MGLKILIADDDADSRRLLEAHLTRWEYEVVPARDGEEAWERLQGPDAPALAVLDWMMPGLDGPAVCRRIREQGCGPRYIMLLTARNHRRDIVAGLDAGADDYLTKPFQKQELRARLEVGRRVLELQTALHLRVRELEAAMEQVQTLRGILPICCYCSRVRDDENYWQRVEAYISQHSEARFSHGICPECWDTVVQDELQALPGRPNLR